MECGRLGKMALIDSTLKTNQPWEAHNKKVVLDLKMGEAFSTAAEFYPQLRKLLDGPSDRVGVNPFAQNDPERAIVGLTKRMIRDTAS